MAAQELLCPFFLSISNRFCKKQKGLLAHLYLKSLYKPDELSLLVQRAELIRGNSSVHQWNRSWFCTQADR